MTDQSNNYETYREWLDGFVSRKVDLGDEAETDEDFSVDDLRAYLDLPSEIASIVPFPPPVMDDETVELLGKSFGDGIGYASWQRYYHELNLTYLMRDRDKGDSLNSRLGLLCGDSGANRGFLMLVLALARHHMIHTSIAQKLRVEQADAIRKNTVESLRVNGVVRFIDFMEKGLAGQHDAFSDPDANLAFNQLAKEFASDDLKVALRVARSARELLGKEEERQKQALKVSQGNFRAKAPYYIPKTAKESSLPGIVYAAYGAFAAHLHDCGIVKDFYSRAEKQFKLWEVPMSYVKFRKHKERNP